MNQKLFLSSRKSVKKRNMQTKTYKTICDKYYNKSIHRAFLESEEMVTKIQHREKQAKVGVMVTGI